MRRASQTAHLDDIDRVLINRLQDGIPLTAQPFAALADELGQEEMQLILRIDSLVASGVLTRFGPFFDAAAIGGAFCLCAMAVPRERFDDVAGIVNSYDAVAHNYERDHSLNMWFVLATETVDGITKAADAIEAATGLAVLRLPKLEEYFVGFRVAA
ncbi:MAG: Lrp/AsnC family transcriptional regulator [Hyphomicrobiaceae bacterium]